MGDDSADAIRVVQNASIENTTLLRQLHVWLGLGSASGAVALVSLATHLPDPAFALVYFIPSLWCFLVGVIMAGASIFFLAMRASAFERHHAAAHNRNDFNDAVEKMPEVFAAPQRLADEANKRRNEYIRRSKSEHERAEGAWNLQRRYRLAWGICLGLSATSFVAGFALPLIQMSFFGLGPVLGGFHVGS
jgi:hypothetical protein